MLQDGPRSAVIERITEAILRHIEGLIAACALIDTLQDAIDALWINFAEVSFQAGIILYCARAYVAPSKEFRRARWIEAYDIAGIIIHSVVIACPGCTLARSQYHIES